MSRLPHWFVLLGSLVVLGGSLCFPFFAQTAHASSSGRWLTFLYASSQGSRNYVVYTPANYHPGTPVPLIVMLHGCTQTPQDFAAGTQMDALADQKQFLVVYPQQSAFANPSLCWNWFLPENQFRNSGEASIIAGITQTVEGDTTDWTIDTRRVYVTGISAGAAMSVIMGATYPDLYAAIGVHSGLEYQAATTASTAVLAQLYGGPDPVWQGDTAFSSMGSHARVLPTIVFHGSFDTVINPINGDDVVQQWMETDHDASGGSYNAAFTSPSSTTHGQIPGGHAYTVRTWKTGSGQEIEEYWTVSGMGHAWSGGSSSGSFTDPLGPGATQAMYTFFLHYTL